MAVDVTKLIQELIVPELREIKLEQKNVHIQIDSLRNEMKVEIGAVKSEIGSLRSEMKAEIGAVKAEIGSLRSEMQTEIGAVKAEVGSLRNEMRAEIRRQDDKLDIALEVRERLAVLESKMAASGH